MGDFSLDVLVTMIHATQTTLLDYCNIFYVGLTLRLLDFIYYWYTYFCVSPGFVYCFEQPRYPAFLAF